MVEHPVTDQERFRELLQQPEEIQYTRHFEQDRLPYRTNIDRDLIEQHLRHPSDLLEFAHQPDRHSREKYAVVFDKSSTYFLKIVLSIDRPTIYIVTAYVVNKQRKELSQILR